LPEEGRPLPAPPPPWERRGEPPSTTRAGRFRSTNAANPLPKGLGPLSPQGLGFFFFFFQRGDDRGGRNEIFFGVLRGQFFCFSHFAQRPQPQKHPKIPRERPMGRPPPPPPCVTRTVRPSSLSFFARKKGGADPEPLGPPHHAQFAVARQEAPRPA